MEMEAPRRSALERSREPSSKKPRLVEEGERDRGPSAGVTADKNRPYAQARSAVSGSGAGNPKFRVSDREREEKNEKDDTGRGGASYQQQQELVAQYRTALAELTFNSKPIITNLTIIAGENLHSAKSIAATVCANVLEVPSEQKLPSLYLLDSIVKNIGRDYIKYFAARLPEVFCKAYRQVDPSVHPSLRHLFGTWKGVFPATCLQSIEKELGFQPMINGSSGGTGTKSDVQTQRTPHSIHVNVKYLEARQRLQQSTRGKEISSEDTEEDVVAPVDDAERPIRATGAGSMRQWSELSKKVPNVQLPRKEQQSEFTNEKKGYKDTRDPDFSTQPSRQKDMGAGRIIDRVNELDEMGRTVDQVKESDETNKPYFGADAAAESTVYRRNGFDADHAYGGYRALGSIPNKSQAPSGHLNRTTWPASKSWKASEEEEYIWDDLGSRSIDYEGASNKRNSWSADDHDKPTNLTSHKWLSMETKPVDSRLNKFDAFQPRKSISGAEERPHFSREHEEQILQPNSRETEPRVNRSPWPLPLCDTSLPAVALDRGISRVSSQTERRPTPLGGTLSTNDNSAIPRSGFHSTLPSSLGTSMDVSVSGGILGQQRQLSLRPPSPTFPSVPSAPLQQQKLRTPLDNDFLPALSSQIGLSSSQPSGHFNRDKFAPFSPDSFPNSSEIPGQKVRTSLNSQPSLPHASQPALSPFLDLKQHLSSLQQSHPDLSMQAVQNETSSYSSHGFRANESKGFSNEVRSSSPVDYSGQSNTSSLYVANLKSDFLPNKQASGLNIQPPLPSGPPPAQAFTSSSPLPTSSAEMASSHGIIAPGLAPPLLAGMLPPLPPGPPPSASVLSTSSQTPNSATISLNPLSSLLSSLVAKGIITSTSTQFPTVSSSQMSKESTSQNSDLDGITSTPPPSLKELPVQRLSTPDPNNLIGIQFKTEIVREFHPSVIDSLLDDLNHRCSECGLRFRLREELQSHLDWHNSEISSIDKMCRRWYSSKISWVSGDIEPQCGPVPSFSLESASGEHMEPMVAADESQSICVLCGDPFEDFYSIERDEWMYKGTVYLNVIDGKYVARSIKDGTVEGPIVHAKCISAPDVYEGVTRFS